jgi:release factor glutamine methyltransferase
LLEDATGKDRAWLLAHPEFEIGDKVVTLLHKQIEKRAEHTPLAYIRGKSEFYGREFIVTPDTLQPRAETETMLDLLCKIIKSHFPSLLEVEPLEEGFGVILVDLGTGSGCLAISAKLEIPSAKIYASDISQAALKVAKQNAKNLHADVTFLQGNLLKPYYNLQSIIYNPFAILANLPYIPTNYPINQAAMHEPMVALFGGEDGLDLYRKMFGQIEEGKGLRAESRVKNPRYILTESLPAQHKTLATIAKEHGYEQMAEQDFIQVFTDLGRLLG